MTRRYEVIESPRQGYQAAAAHVVDHEHGDAVVLSVSGYADNRREAEREARRLEASR